MCAEETLDITWVDQPPFNVYTRSFQPGAKIAFAKTFLEVYGEIYDKAPSWDYSLPLLRLSETNVPLIYSDKPGCIIDPLLGGMFKYPIPVPLRECEGITELPPSLLRLKQDWDHCLVRSQDEALIKRKWKETTLLSEGLSCLNLEWKLKQKKKIHEQIESLKKQAFSQIRRNQIPKPGTDPEWVKNPSLILKEETKLRPNFVFTHALKIEENSEVEFYDIYEYEGGLFRERDIMKEYEKKIPDHIIIFDMEDINYTDRGPRCFCPRNNYGFLLFDLILHQFRPAYDEMGTLFDMRRKLVKGDLLHFPSVRGDLVYDPYTDILSESEDLREWKAKEVSGKRQMALHILLDENLPQKINFRTEIILCLADVILSGAPSTFPIPTIPEHFMWNNKYRICEDESNRRFDINSFNLMFTPLPFTSTFSSPHPSLFQELNKRKQKKEIIEEKINPE